VLGQRNAEWCGHGPILEEDLSNVSLDLIGQARLLYQLVATLKAASAPKTSWPTSATPSSATTRCWSCRTTACSPATRGDRDYATTIVRNFLYSALMVLVWDGAELADADLAAIAAKSLKEASYHLHHARDWLVRMGDGTDESTPACRRRWIT
jgi:ring-1,2-phenylacetyl-CoA epoxidase subunit PaaC